MKSGWTCVRAWGNNHQIGLSYGGPWASKPHRTVCIFHPPLLFPKISVSCSQLWSIFLIDHVSPLYLFPKSTWLADTFSRISRIGIQDWLSELTNFISQCIRLKYLYSVLPSQYPITKPKGITNFQCYYHRAII